MTKKNNWKELDPLTKAQVLSQALPYMRQYAEKIIVIKYGGHAMVNEHLASNQTGKLDDGSWLLSAPSALAGAPPASEDLTGLASTLSGSRYYMYRDLSAAISETLSRLP